MKLVSLNAGHFLGFDGTRRSYLRAPLKPVVGDAAEEAANLRTFASIVDELAPAAVFLQEVDGGSIRTATDGQVGRLAELVAGEYAYRTGPKYRGPVVPSLPILSQLCHGTLYTAGRVDHHYLDTGIRSLVQELRLDGLSVFAVHLANRGHQLRRRDIRRHQLEDLSAITREREAFVVIGDFNFHDGERERVMLRELLDCQVPDPGPTYPSPAPAAGLDLAAVSPDLSVETCYAVETTLSDHRPIVLELEGEFGASGPQ